MEDLIKHYDLSATGDVFTFLAALSNEIDYLLNEEYLRADEVQDLFTAGFTAAVEGWWSTDDTSVPPVGIRGYLVTAEVTR